MPVTLLDSQFATLEVPGSDENVLIVPITEWVLDTALRQQAEPLPVHVVLAQTDSPDEFVVELLPLEAQARQLSAEDGVG